MLLRDRDAKSSGEKLSLLNISQKFWENQNNFLKISFWSMSFIKFSICLNVVGEGGIKETTKTEFIDEIVSIRKQHEDGEIGGNYEENWKIILRQRQAEIDSSHQPEKIEYLKVDEELSIIYFPSK